MEAEDTIEFREGLNFRGMQTQVIHARIEFATPILFPSSGNQCSTECIYESKRSVASVPEDAGIECLAWNTRDALIRSGRHVKFGSDLRWFADVGTASIG